MLSNIGWPEIFVVVVLGVIIIGPERLPGVIQDVRAAIYAARKAINNAKAELNGEFDSLGEEFAPLRDPISKAAEWGRLGPRGALTKALFDGDDSEWEAFNPQNAASGRAKQKSDGNQSQTASPGTSTAARGANSASTGAAATPVSRAGASTSRSFDYSQIYTQQQEAGRLGPGASHGQPDPTPADATEAYGTNSGASSAGAVSPDVSSSSTAPQAPGGRPAYAGMQPPRPGSSAQQAAQRKARRNQASTNQSADYSRIGRSENGAQGEDGSSAGFSWADIT